MEDQFENQRRCLHSHSILHGRSDKKFCDLKCKNAWHNAKNREHNLKFKSVDMDLHRNRKILALFFPMSRGEKYISILPLKEQGFKPDSFNGTMTSSSTNETYYILYDYAFRYEPSMGIKIIQYHGGIHKI